MTELKPCPFCGSEGELRHHPPVVKCEACRCFAFDSEWYGWNARPIEDALRAAWAKEQEIAEDRLLEIVDLKAQLTDLNVASTMATEAAVTLKIENDALKAKLALNEIKRIIEQEEGRD